MKRGSGFILALGMTLLTACASGGGAAPEVPAAEAEYEGEIQGRPTDDPNITAATMQIVQAGGAEGAQAQTMYETALERARASIQTNPQNPKAYLVAGQAAAGAEQWIVADSMFDRAEEIYPPYQDQLRVEREDAWVRAVNRGSEALNAGRTEEALQYLEGADALYAERPEARLALGAAYTRMGQAEQAAEAYLSALEILNRDPPAELNEEQAANWEQDRRQAALNAAQLLSQAGRYEDAAGLLEDFLAQNQGNLDPATELQAITARAGFLAQAGQAEEAEAIYEDVLTRTDLSSEDYFQVGIGFFNTGDYGRAADAFERAAELNPYSRDAYLNLVQSLFAAADELSGTEETPERDEQIRDYYTRLLEAADRVREYDPLNRSLMSYMLRAYQAQAQAAPDAAERQRLTGQTQELYREYQQQLYEVTNIALSMQPGNQAQISGVLTNLAGTAGEQVTLRFSTLNNAGQVIGTSNVQIQAPAEGQTTQFSTEVDVDADFAGWRYELVQ